jgi:molecular chaperone DnaK
MARIVGIDLGTTNSLVAWLNQGRPEIIPNRNGHRLTPSVVGVDRSGHVHVGEAARAQLTTRPESTVAEAKRLMGTSTRLRLGTREYSPTEISAFILRQLKEDAERFFGEPVTEAVVTVPAYFTDAQRQATRDAGELAGLKVERLLNEPTAAALAYGIDHLDAEKHVVVYDLGGGTFDVSVLEMFSGVLDVKASSGNARLGGADFDRLLVQELAARIEREYGMRLDGDAQAAARLKAAAEQAKIELSSVSSANVSLPFLGMVAGRPVSVETELSRELFEGLIDALVRSTLEPLAAALRDAKLAPAAVTDVILVGGSSRVPLVQRRVAEFFGRPARHGVNPDEAVALGAAIQAGLKAGQVSTERGIMISDVSPFTLGVEVSKRAGAALQNGHFSPIIPRNSTVPVSHTEVYSTTSHGQAEVEVRIFQGDAPLTRDNVFLDAYSVQGIPPAPAGSEKIAITFSYDVNGILQVKTKILSTGKEAKLVVDKNALRLSPDERDRARERVERDWSGAAAAPPERPGPTSTAATAPAPIPADDRERMISAAMARLAVAPAAQRARLQPLIDALQVAVPGSPEAARADSALTDLLFELT